MPVQQHPIPQNVTSYQFRLVGDMTLAQFLWLAGGIVIGVLFYSTGLPGFFKWPLVAIPVALGSAIAFVPVQGRPLDQWIIAFLKSIYQPTIYTWQKTEAPLPVMAQTPAVDTTPPVVRPLSQVVNASAATTPPDSTHPHMVPKIHTLVREVPAPTPAAPPPRQPIDIHHLSRIVYEPTPVTQADRQSPKPSPSAIKTPEPAPINQVPSQSAPISEKTVSKASFSTSLPIPRTPSIPNMVVGMTLTPEGKILESTVIDIRLNGHTIRATKSNKLGQFMFAKPLDSAQYHITAEKAGFVFPVFNLPLEGKVIPPIKLQATRQT